MLNHVDCMSLAHHNIHARFTQWVSAEIPKGIAIDISDVWNWYSVKFVVHLFYLLILEVFVCLTEWMTNKCAAKYGTYFNALGGNKESRTQAKLEKRKEEQEREWENCGFHECPMKCWTHSSAIFITRIFMIKWSSIFGVLWSFCLWFYWWNINHICSVQKLCATAINWSIYVCWYNFRLYRAVLTIQFIPSASVV